MSTQQKPSARSLTSREWLSLGILAETAAHNAGLNGNTAARDYYRDLAQKCDEQSEDLLNTPKLRVLAPVTVLTRHQTVDPDDDTAPVFIIPPRPPHEDR